MSTSAMTPGTNSAPAGEHRLTAAERTGAVLSVLGRRAVVTVGGTAAVLLAAVALLYAVGRWLGWEFAAGGSPFDGVAGISAEPGRVTVTGLGWIVPLATTWTAVVLAAALPRLVPSLLGLGATRRAVGSALLVVDLGMVVAAVLTLMAAVALTGSPSSPGALETAGRAAVWILVVVLGATDLAILWLHGGVVRAVALPVAVVLLVAAPLLLGSLPGVTAVPHLVAAMPYVVAVILAAGLVLGLRRLRVD